MNLDAYKLDSFFSLGRKEGKKYDFWETHFFMKEVGEPELPSAKCSPCRWGTVCVGSGVELQRAALVLSNFMHTMESAAAVPRHRVPLWEENLSQGPRLVATWSTSVVLKLFWHPYAHIFYSR